MASPARIVLVEDEDAVRDAVAIALRDAGYGVLELDRGAGFAGHVEAFRPDLAVLDVMLPDADGFALAAALRETVDLPVVFVTARDGVEDRLRGFGAGADDYLVKPVVLEELLARVRAVLRRAGRLSDDVVEGGDLVLDEAQGRAVRAGHVLPLTATELRLLGFLVRHRGRVLSKLQLLTQVWGYEHYDPNVVEVHVSALRRKLEVHGPRILHTIRGLGYELRPGCDR
jgi:two-component system OmpR family response regulator